MIEELKDLGFYKFSQNAFKKKLNQESSITVILNTSILVESKKFKCYSYEVSVSKIEQLIKIFK